MSTKNLRREERHALLRRVEYLLEGENNLNVDDDTVKLAEIDASLKLGRMGPILKGEVHRGEDLLGTLMGDVDEIEGHLRNHDEGLLDEAHNQSQVSESADLFALQVYVESLTHLPDSDENSSTDDVESTTRSKEYSVAFRLLDFPTVLIERAGKTIGEFQSGKSCLFELPFEEAIAGLQSAPLYLMLLRLPHDRDLANMTAKEQERARVDYGTLVGSTSLDLSGLIGLDNVGPEGCLLPSVTSTWGWKRGTFPLFDLMGNQVACVTARVRICSFGDGLLPHLTLKDLETSKVEGSLVDQGRENTRTENDLQHRRQKDREVQENELEHSNFNLPIPAALLETMNAVEKRLTKIEKLQRKAFRHIDRRKNTQQHQGFKRQHNSLQGSDDDHQGGWLPRPNQDEASCLPPAMYFFNGKSSSRHSDGEEDRDDSDDDFASLGDFEDQRGPEERDLLLALAPRVHGRDSRITERRRARGSLSSPYSSDGEESALKAQYGTSHRDERYRGRHNDPKNEATTQLKVQHSAPRRRRILKVRKTRTQIMRERVTRRRSQAQGGSETANPNVGYVQLTADLARSRALNERNPEERQYLLERRKAQARRQSQSSGNLQLEALTQSAIAIDSGVDGADREARARQEQLELMLRGEISPAPAFQFDASLIPHDSTSVKAPPPLLLLLLPPSSVIASPRPGDNSSPCYCSSNTCFVFVAHGN